MKMKMKNSLIAICMLITMSVYAQENKKFVKAMETNIQLLDSAQTIEQFQNASNAFERIAGAEKKEWLPDYYNAYANLMIGMKQTENIKKDEYFDKAEALINKADEISKDNSEITAMHAWIISMKISVDPMNRGMQLGMQSGMLTETAMKLDPENPRPYLLKGLGAMYTPEQYGGGKDKALPILEQAVEKFSKFKPSSSIMPKWGEAKAKSAVEECKN
jgi:tetratricopeptide (TPR) repeat protein